MWGWGGFALARHPLCSPFSCGHWGGWVRTWLSGAGGPGVPQPLRWALGSLVLLEDREEVGRELFMPLWLGEGSHILS